MMGQIMTLTIINGEIRAVIVGTSPVVLNQGIRKTTKIIWMRWNKLPRYIFVLCYISSHCDNMRVSKWYTLTPILYSPP